jgi:formate dehydrogenase iron-sulfur subunit
VPACPFGVLDKRHIPRHSADPPAEILGLQLAKKEDGRVWKCTLCYDRLKGGHEPACAKACPTDSIQFGPLDELRARAADRLHALRAKGRPVQLYGESSDAQPGTGGLHAFFLLDDAPEIYNLPPSPTVPTSGAPRSWLSAAAAALGLAALALTTATLSRRT